MAEGPCPLAPSGITAYGMYAVKWNAGFEKYIAEGVASLVGFISYKHKWPAFWSFTLSMSRTHQLVVPSSKTRTEKLATIISAETITMGLQFAH